MCVLRVGDCTGGANEPRTSREGADPPFAVRSPELATEGVPSGSRLHALATGGASRRCFGVDTCGRIASHGGVHAAGRVLCPGSRWVSSSRGSRCTLGSPKLRTVLAALLVDANSVVSSDRLVDILWGDDPPVSARGHVAEARLPAPRCWWSPTRDPDRLLVTRAPGYVLRVGPEEYDAARFEDRMRTARARRTRGGASAAVATLDAALGLWRGPAFAEFAYDDFARAEATRLEELRVTAVEDRVDAKLTLGRHEELIGELERTVDAHPLRERSRAQLMLALYRAGRQVEALRAYQDHRRYLVDEVGIEPSTALRELEAAMVVQAPGARLRTISTPRSDTGSGCGGGIVPAAIGTGRTRRRRGHARVRRPDHARGRDPDRPRPAWRTSSPTTCWSSIVDTVTMRLEAPDAAATPAFARCPYKGLACFESTDADYFFGRERLVAELVARVAVERFVGVVGVSGSGKSSLLLAGLCPALRAGALPGSEQWLTVLLTPGAEPLDRLARALAGGVPGLSLDVVRARVCTTTPTRSSTSPATRSATKPPGSRLVVVVDQFEELFTMCRDDELRRRFVDRSGAIGGRSPSSGVGDRGGARRLLRALRGADRAGPAARIDPARGDDDRPRAPPGDRGAGPASGAPARARAHRRHPRRRGRASPADCRCSPPRCSRPGCDATTRRSRSPATPTRAG